MSEEQQNPVRGLVDVDRLIHEPARLMLVTILYSVESADFLYLQRESALTRGNLSTHLAKLEEGGYLRIEKTYRGKIPLTDVKDQIGGDSKRGLAPLYPIQSLLRSIQNCKQSMQFWRSRV